MGVPRSCAADQCGVCDGCDLWTRGGPLAENIPNALFPKMVGNCLVNAPKMVATAAPPWRLGECPAVDSEALAACCGEPDWPPYARRTAMAGPRKWLPRRPRRGGSVNGRQSIPKPWLRAVASLIVHRMLGPAVATTSGMALPTMPTNAPCARPRLVSNGRAALLRGRPMWRVRWLRFVGERWTANEDGMPATPASRCGIGSSPSLRPRSSGISRFRRLRPCGSRR